MSALEANARSKQNAHSEFLLRLADNALILSHRLSEWTGHGPALEEDIALTNIALDLLGQARMLYTRAGALTNPACDEDALAYFRNPDAFRNVTALELPNSGVHAARGATGDYAFTILRQSLFSAYMLELWHLVASSDDEVLAGIAMKAIKETRYHWRHASDWTIRLGDGTASSNQRMQAALDSFFPYTNEWFALDAIDARALQQSLKALALTSDALDDEPRPMTQTPWQQPDEERTPEEAFLTKTAAVLAKHLHQRWLTQIEALFEQAHLRLPPPSQLQTRGRYGCHGEHLSLLLAEMQSVARAHPGASW